MDAYLNRYGLEGVFPLAETELARLALLPCGELAVPEAARAFMLRSAEVLVHPTNEPFSVLQETSKVTRPAENMMFLLSANIAGPIGFDVEGANSGDAPRSSTSTRTC